MQGAQVWSLLRELRSCISFGTARKKKKKRWWAAMSSLLILSSVQFSRSVMSDSLQPHGLQHARPPCPSPTPGVHSNLCVLSQWCHPTISSSVIPFSCLQSFPASGGQIIGVSASALLLPMNIQDWCPLGWIGWISLLSKGLSRIFANTTVQKYQASILASL